jgi:ProP effector
MRTHDAIALIRILTERWPKTFYPESKKRKPLKVGIFKDLKAAAPDIEPKMLRLALRVYTTSGKYLVACSKGQTRVDLKELPRPLLN